MSTDMFRLDGKVAFIPGGSGGIGSTLAAGICDAGAQLAIVDRDGDGLARTCSRLSLTGAHPLAIAADLTKKEEADRAVAETVAHFGRLDIIINAIGGGAGNVLFDAEEYPVAEWDWIFDLNLRTTVLSTQAAVKAMIEGGRGGKVVNISSVQRTARHQRRVFRLCCRQRCHRFVDSPVGYRMGQTSHHGQCHRPDFRRHSSSRHAARGPRVQSRRGESHPSG